MSDKEKKTTKDQKVSSEEEMSVGEFDLLINVITEYYLSVEGGEPEDGDEWKKDAEMTREFIPSEIDDEIKKAFKGQLKRFQ